MPRASLVIPVYNEGDQITPVLERVVECIQLPFEVVVVYDDPSDTTAPYIDKFGDPRIRGVLNTIGPGPARAIRAGFAAATAPTLVVTMADGSDDLSLVDDMVRLVERGCAVVAASRYMAGGAQVGGPMPKKTLSWLAGVSLYTFARVGTHDATNSFKAYSKEFVDAVGVEGDAGFEIGIELVAKARRHRLPIAELPTIWLERQAGDSRFQLTRWLPVYLHWYFYAFGPKLPAPQTQG